jgi:hypothetical protein
MSNENLTIICKKTAVFGKYASVPTDRIGCRNTSCSGAALKVKMHRKGEVPDNLEGMRKLTEWKGNQYYI